MLVSSSTHQARITGTRLDQRNVPRLLYHIWSPGAKSFGSTQILVIGMMALAGPELAWTTAQSPFLPDLLSSSSLQGLDAHQLYAPMKEASARSAECLAVASSLCHPS